MQVGTAPDGRPSYTRPVSSLQNVIFLTNTDEGRQWSVALKVDRPFQNGFFAGGSYMYNDSRSVHDGTSSTASSQWGNVRVPGDPNNPPLTRSHFAAGHRITLSGAYEIPLGKGFSGNVSVYYNGQSGRTYSLTFNGDVNGDARTSNDLHYVPRSADEVVIQNGTWADLAAYIDEDACLCQSRGRIAERNCARGPWTNEAERRDPPPLASPFSLALREVGRRAADTHYIPLAEGCQRSSRLTSRDDESILGVNIG